MNDTSSSTEQETDKPRVNPDRYEIRCICGVSISGDRDSSPQLVECSRCRWEWFILPKTAYPTPSDEKEKRKKQRQREKRRRELLRNIALSPVYFLKFTGTVSYNFCSWIFNLIKQSVLAVVRFFTPYRIVFTLISLFLLVTVYVMISKARVSNAVNTFREESQAGMASLQKKDLASAASHYQRASDALAIMQGTEPYQLDVSLFARETFALTNLAQDDLYSIANNAHQSAVKEGKQEWSRLFEYRYKSKWIILDLILPTKQSLKETGNETYQHPLWLDQQLILLELPVSILPDAESDSVQNARAIISGELLEMKEHQYELAPEFSSCWKINFKKNSLFLWGHETTSTYILLEDGPWLKSEKVKDVLTRQRKQSGLIESDPSDSKPPMSNTGRNS